MPSLPLATWFCCNLARGRSPGRCRSCTFYMFVLLCATYMNLYCSGSWTEMDFHTNKLTRNFLQFFAWLACLQTEILWCFMPSKTKGFVLFHLPTCQCRGNKYLRQVLTRQCHSLVRNTNWTEGTVDFDKHFTIFSSKLFIYIRN